MASPLTADIPSFPAPEDVPNDPFMAATPVHTHQRYSDFDEESFAAGPGSSPTQAKRALEAHLTETDRRLDEAGKLGTALVAQRKALAEQLQEVERLEAQGELKPELRQKLVDIEKEYNFLAQESARVFLPKQRVPSNETNPGSPFVPEGRNGRRSVSPHKFEIQATGSPNKLSVPNRKIRNQPSNRVHDIEFAAEISTSLISQVRNLQALLAERDVEVKDLQQDRSRLEVETENLQQRLKVIDESENRYKEENWNLETRIQELVTQQKEAADREKKLTQALNVSKTEKTATQKELDEVKLSHAKLLEEHAAAVKHHDIELGTAKRNIVMAEGERSAMQRKIDDLMSQNTELAKAVSAERGRTTERKSASGTSDEDFETAADNGTPEHSPPPPSPIKGTPRHSMLETETIKTSLLHAQRTIQSQRSLIHREKTEKLELRRIIQDLRDDLEKVRNDVAPAPPPRRSRKAESREFKKPPRLLGGFRSSRQEIVLDDPEWEDQHDVSPRASHTSTSQVPRQSIETPNATDSSDHFDTANEAGESAFETAFETANERGTETEDFQTTHEDLSGSDSAATETEAPSRGFGRMKRPPSLLSGHHRNQSRESLHSTASTSADEQDVSDMRTPVGTITSRNRFRLSRGPLSRNGRQHSEEPNFRGSPASFAGSAGGTPQGGQSLFAELQDMTSDNDSAGGGTITPSRRGARSVTPGSMHRPVSPPPAVPAIPRVVMVDTGVMTDPVEIAVGSGNHFSVIGPMADSDGARPRTMESVIGPAANRSSMSWLSIREDDPENSRRFSTFSYSDASVQHDIDMDAKLAQFPLPPTSLPPTPLPSLSISALQSEHIEPQEEAISPVALSFTHLATETVVPEPVPEVVAPALVLSSIVGEALEPVAEPEVPPPTLTMTPLLREAVEPVAELPPALSMTTLASQTVEPVAALPPTLSMTSLASEAVEPVAELPPALSMTNILTETVAPIAEPIALPPPLTLSHIQGEVVDPVAEPEVPPPALSLSLVQAEILEPIAEPQVPLPALNLTVIQTEAVEPIAEPEVPPPTLTLSGVQAEMVEPIAEPEVPAVALPVAPTLSMSSLVVEHVEPVLEPESESEILAAAVPVPIPVPEPVVAELSMSSIVSEHLEPISEPEIVVPQPALALTTIHAEHIEPREEPEVKPAMPTLAYTNIATEQVEPVAEPEPLPPALSVSHIVSEGVIPIPEPVVLPPTLALSTIAAETVQPVSEPEPAAPELAISSITAEQIEPVAEPAPAPPTLGFTNISTEYVEPVAEPVPVQPTLGFTNISTEHVEPVAEPVPVQPTLGFTSLWTEHVEPIPEPQPQQPSLVISSINAEGIAPVIEPSPPLALSAIAAEAVEPVNPVAESLTRDLTFATIESIETIPATPRSPWKEAFILPTLGRGRRQDSETFIAEDETSQSFKDLADNEHTESQPFREVSTNTDARSQRKQVVPMTDQGAQTSLTADEIDQLVSSKRPTLSSLAKTMSLSSIGTTGTTIHRPRDITSSPTRSPTRSIRKGSDDLFEGSPTKRPTSAGSQRTSILDAPPLPPNHRELIEAARSNSSHGTQSAMGPPLWPASAAKNRPQTPSQRPMSPASLTPRIARGSPGHGTAEVQSISKLTARSRQSSVSSFASELDNRFNMRTGGMPFDATGFGSNTDPRMIQAITQTMIGEFLWKYTRKPGRGEMSEKRHRRYFWVHPYTRTLYWSDQDPSTAGRSELRAKSVPIEAVRVVTDDNPMPPGLHRKSLIVIAPGRTIKFTCTTGQRHETWFNALSYLLLRTNEEGHADAEELAENIARDNSGEFSPQNGRQSANSNTRPQGPPSLSSYNSRTTRTESPGESYMYSIPTLVRSGQSAPTLQRSSSGTLSKISGYLKPGNFGSIRNRTASGLPQSIYEASEAHDSAEDLREMIERQDRESDRLENVRACCDGKHDVGTLHHLMKKGRNSHAHPGHSPSPSPTPLQSMRSRS